MPETHFHRMLKAKVMEVLDARSAQIAGGACKDYNHYSREVGFMQGAAAVLDIAADLERDIDGNSNSSQSD